MFCNRTRGEEDGYWGEEGELYSGEDGGYESFWYEADDLGIPGVGFTMWATPHPIFEVRNKEAMGALMGAVEGEYRIVVKEDVGEYRRAEGGVKWALRAIRQAREE